jgi:hypothetical protein
VEVSGFGMHNREFYKDGFGMHNKEFYKDGFGMHNREFYKDHCYRAAVKVYGFGMHNRVLKESVLISQL